MYIRVKVVGGRCSSGVHQRGQIFKVNWMTPEGLCVGAWNSIAPYIVTLLCGGQFIWEKDKKCTQIHCPEENGIVLELKFIEE